MFREMRPRLLFVAAAVIFAAAGCQRDGVGASVLVGRPAGPYRATLRLEPDRPRAGVESTVILAIEDARTSKPVSDLQVVHERVIHSFLVSRDFRHFAHTHHEDFAALRPQDVAAATFRYPHVFPFSGGYELVIEFTHRDRTWIKRFDFVVEEAAATTPRLEPRRVAKSGGYRFSLSVDPDPPVAGKEARLVCRIETAAGEPVTDLAMVLGSEVHLATWRNDGEHFGHTHAWTPEMAAMMGQMRDMAAMGHDTGAGMAAMMMATPAVQHFHGPEVPLRHVFAEPGVYAIFLDLAPGGRRTVADFVLRVVP